MLDNSAEMLDCFRRTIDSRPVLARRLPIKKKPAREVTARVSQLAPRSRRFTHRCDPMIHLVFLPKNQLSPWQLPLPVSRQRR